MAPPGIVHVVGQLPVVLGPPGLVYLTIVFLCQGYLDLEVPRWLLILACVLSLPSALAMSVYYKDWTDARNASANGAVLPPRIKDPTPGSLRTLAAAVNNFKTGYPGDIMDVWRESHGDTINLRILFENRMFTTEPEHIKAILATQFDVFEKGNAFFKQVKSVLGTGVFNSDGELWKFHRAMTRPFFNKDRVSHFDNFEKHADDAISQIRERLREGYPVDFQDAVARFTLDSATEFLFGNDVCSLSAGLPYPASMPIAASKNAAMATHPANHFAHAFLECQKAIALRSRYGVNWPLKEFWVDASEKHMAVVGGFIDPILAEAVSKKRTSVDVETDWNGDGKGDREVKDGETLLDHLVNYTEDKKILKDEILNMMVAGRDTTASTLSFVIYMLAENPHVLKQLREEILLKVGGSRRPTYDDLRDMKYLRAVINETLRLYPPVPFNVRATSKATLWPSKVPGGKPFYIPANTKTPYSVFLMQRRTDLWGPTALEFDPMRFLDERLHTYLIPNPYIFLPFNAGPRICLGQQFAYNEVSFFLVRLLQSFCSVSLAQDAQPPCSIPPKSWRNAGGRKAIEKLWPKAHLTMYSHEGVWVRMEEASAVEAI